MNLNDIVEITLTKTGAKILNDFGKDINSRGFHSVSWIEDYKEKDIYKSALWDIFNLFGDYCTAGSEHVFFNLKQTNNDSRN